MSRRNATRRHLSRGELIAHYVVSTIASLAAGYLIGSLI